ncbi:hypothetical protein AVEN_156011-1 [Araneus ventricosus]|uniref:Uncharacterized protein n=1 Tax=Araneus ventricosus TaxID=182803 RepID=A0A4Y2RK09_ARAVE|nr:hypothetical protein AVEN_156011-1 [Araneus ventricosus]
MHCSLLCKHCIGKSCENPMPAILDNESEEGDAPAPIDMVDEQLECEDIELQVVSNGLPHTAPTDTHPLLLLVELKTENALSHSSAKIPILR